MEVLSLTICSMGSPKLLVPAGPRPDGSTGRTREIGSLASLRPPGRVPDDVRPPRRITGGGGTFGNVIFIEKS